MAPDGGVVDVSTEKTRYRWGGEEKHGFTSIVSACEAWLAGVARDIGLDGDFVTDAEVRDGRVHSENFAGGFVAENVFVCNNHWTDTTRMPEVDVGTGNGGWS